MNHKLFRVGSSAGGGAGDGGGVQAMLNNLSTAATGVTGGTAATDTALGEGVQTLLQCSQCERASAVCPFRDCYKPRLVHVHNALFLDENQMVADRHVVEAHQDKLNASSSQNHAAGTPSTLSSPLIRRRAFAKSTNR